MMTDIQNTRDIWNKRWEGSERKERLTFLGKMMFDTKKKALRKVLNQIKINNMIEVGAGLGYTLSVFQEAGINAVGIDISEHAIAVCKRKGLNVSLKPLEEVSETYDLVSSDGLLEHFLNFELYARHLMNISSKYVLLIQPNHNSFPGKTIFYLSQLIKGRENVHEYNYLIDDFINIFDKYGFELLRNEPIFGDVFRLLLFQKTPRFSLQI